MEKIEVDPPEGMSDTEFIKSLIDNTVNYQNYTGDKPVQYNSSNSNCITLVNSLLFSSGKNKGNIIEAADDFSGWDSDDNGLLDEKYFKSPVVNGSQGRFSLGDLYHLIDKMIWIKRMFFCMPYFIK